MKQENNSIVFIRDLLQDILKSANNNLDIYVNGSMLELGKSPVDPKKMEKLFSILPEIDDKDIQKIIEENKKYTGSSKFFAWLYKYAKNIKITFHRTKPLCDMEIEDFDALAGYCIENVLLHNLGIQNAEIKDQQIYSADNISILCSIIDSYFESIFYDGISKSVINKNISQSTKLSMDKCNILWNYYLKEEQALWRKYSMQLQVTIDKKLNDFLDAMLNMEEDE